MGKMYTLKPDENISVHMSESIAMLNQLTESVGIGYYRNFTTIHGISPDSVRFIIEHACNTIEMLDEIENHYMSEIQKLNEDLDHFRDLAISRNEELEQERERSNQLEEKNRKVKTKFELAKKFLHLRREEVSRLKEELHQTQIVKDAQKKVIDEKENALLRLNHEIWDLQEQAEYWEDLAKKYADPDGYKPNNPANFCGNCKYLKTHPNDVGTCENIYGRYSKVVDPDDASCQAFESNNSVVIDKPNNPANFCGNCKHFVIHPNDIGTCNNKHADPYIVDPDDTSCDHFEPNVVICKPEFPCCDHCNHEDCDDCTLCPF